MDKGGKDVWDFVRQHKIPYIKKEKFHSAEGLLLKTSKRKELADYNLQALCILT
jgi:hypothetical protein